MEAAEAAINAAKNGKTVPMHTFTGTVEHALAHIEEAAVHGLMLTAITTGMPSSVSCVVRYRFLSRFVPSIIFKIAVRVVKLHGEGAVKRRIMDMGLTKGVDVQIRKVAPLGDFLFHRNTRPVPDKLVGSSQGIEQCRFSAVRVARKGNSHGLKREKYF